MLACSSGVPTHLPISGASGVPTHLPTSGVPTHLPTSGVSTHLPTSLLQDIGIGPFSKKPVNGLHINHLTFCAECVAKRTADHRSMHSGLPRLVTYCGLKINPELVISESAL